MLRFYLVRNSISLRAKLLQAEDCEQTLMIISGGICWWLITLICSISAVRGSAKAVTNFSDEALLKVNRETLQVNFTLMAAPESCPADIDLMSAQLPERQLPADSEVEIMVPSIRAMFDVKIWRL